MEYYSRVVTSCILHTYTCYHIQYSFAEARSSVHLKELFGRLSFYIWIEITLQKNEAHIDYISINRRYLHIIITYS